MAGETTTAVESDVSKEDVPVVAECYFQPRPKVPPSGFGYRTEDEKEGSRCRLPIRIPPRGLLTGHHSRSRCIAKLGD